jgi:hypothetical protein
VHSIREVEMLKAEIVAEAFVFITGKWSCMKKPAPQHCPDTKAGEKDTGN